MTEKEWIDHAAPGLMLRHLGKRASERKLLLFNCHCAEFVWQSLLCREIEASLEIAWAAADGLTSQSELAASVAQQPRMMESDEDRYAGRVLEAALRKSDIIDVMQVRRDVEALAVLLAKNNSQDTANASYEARTAMTSLLRDIFGNPFRPISFDASWLTSTVVALARQMYDSRDFSVMPILADALQDAGCDHEEVLNHCRGSRPHVRGCFVVDGCLRKN